MPTTTTEAAGRGSDGLWRYREGGKGFSHHDLTSTNSQRRTDMKDLFARQAVLMDAPTITDDEMRELDQIQDAIEFKRRSHRVYQRDKRRAAGARAVSPTAPTFVPDWCDDCDRESIRVDHSLPNGRHVVDPPA